MKDFRSSNYPTLTYFLESYVPVDDDPLQGKLGNFLRAEGTHRFAELLKDLNKILQDNHHPTTYDSYLKETHWSLGTLVSGDGKTIFTNLLSDAQSVGRRS